MVHIDRLMESVGISFSSLKEFGISDIIDIIITAYGIYIVMSLIKETRAWSLFKGIIILAMLKVAFSIFELYTISWIIDEIYKVGLIATIVLFQPEIRKVLEQLGKGSFVFSQEDISYDIQKKIKKTIKNLSKSKTGALICIEQEVALGEFEGTGILLDAIISTELLVNIFEDKTPLHDGAVILRNKRIAAAGCILPVTSLEIGKELGTRHRAAVGLAEVSDAFIIIVSEETGNISVAKDGKLNKNITLDEVFVMFESCKKSLKSQNTKDLCGGKDKK